MSILEVFKLIGGYDTLIRVEYFSKMYPDEGSKHEKSGIMKLRNVNYRQIDHWTYRKKVRRIQPAVDSKGRCYMYIQICDEE